MFTVMFNFEDRSFIHIFSSSFDEKYLSSNETVKSQKIEQYLKSE